MAQKMKIGRFNIVNLSESGRSDMSGEAKVSINIDDSVENKARNAKESEKVTAKNTVKENSIADIERPGVQEALGANVIFMQYSALLASHQQFLMDYLSRDAQRQEQIQKIIQEIIELTEINARLTIENESLSALFPV